MSCFFSIPLEPMGKGRPRVSKGRAYTPKRTSDWASAAITFIKSQAGRNGFEDSIKGPAEVNMTFLFRRPKSRRSPEPTKKPDGDNVEKMVLDCMVKAGVIEDDSSVVKCSWQKVWAAEGKDGSIFVTARRC